MSGSLNRVHLIGNLGEDPTLRETQNGVHVANFNIATNEYFKDKNGDKQQRTEWHRIVAWGRLAEIAHEYLKKGAQVAIEGRLKTRSYTEDKTGPIKFYTTEVHATNLVMLGRRDGAPVTEEVPPEKVDVPPADDSVIPFDADREPETP